MHLKTRISIGKGKDVFLFLAFQENIKILNIYTIYVCLFDQVLKVIPQDNITNTDKSNMTSGKKNSEYVHFDPNDGRMNE